MNFKIDQARIFDWVSLIITLDKQDLAQFLQCGFIGAADTFIGDQNKQITITLKYDDKSKDI